MRSKHTKQGDIWKLGRHRLMCGDSTNRRDVLKLMDGDRADTCITSPPYGSQRDYSEEVQKAGLSWDNLMSGVFTDLPMKATGQVLVNLGLIHRGCEWQPYWFGWLDFMRQEGWRRFGWYVWDQGPGLPGDWNGRLAPSFEFVFHFNRKPVKPQKFVPCVSAGTIKNNGGLRKKNGDRGGYSHRGRPIQDTKIADSTIRVCRQKAPGIHSEHPAIFPVELPSFAMKCWPGLCYEPFSGSGTTIIAAERLGMTCYGMELTPRFVDVAVRRWEQETGITASKV